MSFLMLFVSEVGSQLFEKRQVQKSGARYLLGRFGRGLGFAASRKLMETPMGHAMVRTYLALVLGQPSQRPWESSLSFEEILRADQLKKKILLEGWAWHNFFIFLHFLSAATIC